MVGGYQLDALPATVIAPSSALRTYPAPTALPQNRQDADQFRNTLAEQLIRAETPYSKIYKSKAALSDALAEIDTQQLARIDQTARAMEGLLLETLLKQMWATLPESQLFGNGLDTKFYREMWLEEVAADVSANGGGVGIAATVAWEMILLAQSATPGSLAGNKITDEKLTSDLPFDSPSQ